MTKSKSTSNADAAVIEARLADLSARCGDRWSEAEREQIRGRIARTLRLSAALRRIPLTNADEPGNRFAPFRGDERR
jgi:hypothetical protein